MYGINLLNGFILKRRKKPMTKRDIATKIALHYIGTFYKWGGDDPSGFDCSGFVIEILKSVGLFSRKADARAKDLAKMYQKVGKPEEGCLVFYGNPIYHVEYCFNSDLSIGASGGGSATTSIEKAIEQNAFIKMRPIRKKNVTCYVNPFTSISSFKE
jgi:cell wall-associated NlpC family hydrolase